MENLLISICSSVLAYIILSQDDNSEEEKSDINENVKLEIKI